MQTLGQRLFLLRADKGVSQKQVCDKTGISTNAYSYYESDKSEPTASRIVWLCDYFGVSVDYLLGRAEK